MTSSAAQSATAPIRIANCSGFYGDRLSAAHEMVEGGSVDVLTGDWLDGFLCHFEPVLSMLRLDSWSEHGFRLSTR